jgi:hypothetical protein
MGKLLYILAILSFLIALADSGGPPGSNRQAEATVLLLLAIAFAIAGFYASRAATKKCPHCSERVKKDASKCKHCGSSLETEKVPRPANEQRS